MERAQQLISEMQERDHEWEVQSGEVQSGTTTPTRARRSSQLRATERVTMAIVPPPIKKPSSWLFDLTALVAALQFAVVILITRDRIASTHLDGPPGESFLVISMLLITSASGRIDPVFSSKDDLSTDKWGIIRFFCLSLPVFLFMVVCELWFLHLLLSFYDPVVHLEGLAENAAVVLNLGRTLGVVKILIIILAMGIPTWKAWNEKRKEQAA